MAEKTTQVLVVGAGISGLATAHFLKKNGFKVLITEKADRAGGAIRSEKRDGFLVEYGPNSTLDTNPFIHELFSDAGIESQMEYANEESKNRYIVRDKKLNCLPMSPLAFAGTPHFSWKAKLRIFKEPFIPPAAPDADETLADFVVRRLGQEFLDYAIDPFVAGVYAGLPEALSVRSGFPKLHALEQKYGSLIKGTILGARERKKRQEESKQSAKLFSFPNGMQTMIDALVKLHGDELLLNTEIEDLQPTESGYRVAFRQGDKAGTIFCEKVVFTIPVHNYPKMNLPLLQPLLPEFEKIYHPPVTMVFFGYQGNPSARPLDGFGFLIPRKENFNILGTIWSSTIFKNRAPKGGIALTTFVGGSRQPENALKSEAELKEMVLQDLGVLMGIKAQPDLVVTQSWPKAIPQYNVGHHLIIEKVAEFEKAHPGLHFSGNFRGGISVGDCIKQSKTIAEELSKEKATIHS
ncbi:MAG: protoporphyrinogen oxidase [Calditrichia bacterium]